MALEIRNATAEDFDGWMPLWQGYLTFYKTSLTDEVTQATWARILDPMNLLTARLAVKDGVVLGFAHHHTHLTTWDVRPTCYLEDLFVSPEARGLGVGKALLDDLVALGKEKDWVSVYWITAEDNVTAQKLYDSYNKRDAFYRYSVTL